MGLSEELASQIVRSRYLTLFEEAVNEGADCVRVADVILNVMKDLRRKGVDVDSIEAFKLKEMFKKLNFIPKESIPQVLEKLAEGKEVEEAMKNIKEAIELCLECYREDNEKVPEDTTEVVEVYVSG